jgi:type I restriction enzyme S subunit
VALAGCDLATNQGFKALILHSAEPQFYYHFFKTLSRAMIRVASGTTFLEVSGREFGNIKVQVPPASQQTRIAEVLDTVDEAIRSTERVIAKLEQVKRGLLHDLLTRGIDDNGEIRDPERHPEQFKHSPLGRIPKAWEIVRLGEEWEEASDGPFGSNLKSDHYRPTGIRVVRLQNIGNGKFDEGAGAFVSEEHANRLRRHDVRGGDLLIASLGDDAHPFARACVFPGHLQRAINKADCFRVRMKPSRAINSFIAMVLTCPVTRRGLSALAQGVTRDRVNLGSLSRFRLSLPALDEQVRSVERFGQVETAIADESRSLEKLRLLKKGLMDDLLTGRVRVPVPDGDHA